MLSLVAAPSGPLSAGSSFGSVLAVVAAVLAYGVASLLQAMAGRRTPGATAGRLLLSPLVLGGLALDLVGFAAGAAALRDLPLFLVQGATAASILVTALLAALVLDERPTRRETLAMPLILAGVVALALSADPGPASGLPVPVAVGLMLAAPLFGALTWYGLRDPRRLPAISLAVLAGLSYGSATLAVRGMTAMARGDLLFPVMLLTVAAHALLGVVLVTTAMRRNAVNAVTGVLFATETAVPAALGVLLLGDRPAPGCGWATVAGCALLGMATALLSRATTARPQVPRPRTAGTEEAADAERVEAEAGVTTPG